jgi:hypothetical protein
LVSACKAESAGDWTMQLRPTKHAFSAGRPRTCGDQERVEGKWRGLTQLGHTADFLPTVLAVVRAP